MNGTEQRLQGDLGWSFFEIVGIYPGWTLRLLFMVVYTADKHLQEIKATREALPVVVGLFSLSSIYIYFRDIRKVASDNEG